MKSALFLAMRYPQFFCVIVFTCSILFTVFPAHAQLAGTPEAFDYFGWTVGHGDFNGDGFDDFAIGVPNEDLDGVENGGAVHVLYGTFSGLSDVGSQFWHQNSDGVAGLVEQGDAFGYALATADFNGDGFDDLAVGVPGEDIGTVENAGAVHVLYGSATGLAAEGDQLWHQNVTGIADEAETEDRFGLRLGAGDLNGDGFADLAVGVPREDVGTVIGIEDAGAVHILYGSASGLTTTGSELWNTQSPGMPETTSAEDDYLGNALAMGDFDGNGTEELAIGISYFDVGSTPSAGAVMLLVWDGSGLAPDPTLWSQDTPGVAGAAEQGDIFGFPLVTGDFNSDGAADLAIGISGEDIGNVGEAGAVQVLYGTATGLMADDNDLWHQDLGGIEGAAGAGHFFGSALAVGDFDGNGTDDLAIGVPGETVGAAVGAGVVVALPGSSSGLTDDEEVIRQGVVGVLDTPETNDSFGYALSAGDFDADGMSNLAVGVPFEDLEADDAGAVNIISTPLAPGDPGSQFLYQGATLVAAEPNGPETTVASRLHVAAPNPFRSRTTLRYTISEPGPVHLAVYDLLGREVVVLVNEFQGEGIHETVFDADHLSNGIYLVRLETTATIQTHRLTRLR